MKRIILLLLICFGSDIIFACTTFCINKDGHIVFGRNYDWVTGAGIVNTNLRGLLKTSMETGDGATTTWVSKYGSITFNQYGKEFPTGGMNEKGLVVELMWLDGTVYAKTDDRPAVGVLQWLQYQLDNASTIDEVISSDSKVRISKKATPLHYLVADAAGNVATIEFIDGKMLVHKGKELPFPVLTNNTYESSVKVANQYVNKNANGLDNSLERFVKACNMINQFKMAETEQPLTNFAFSVLDRVSQGSFTKWSIVYDITNKEIHFKTEDNRDIKTVRFGSFDFSCSQSYKMYNMNQDGKGDISKQFISPDIKIKEKIMDQAITESSSRVSISPKERKQLLEFEKKISCKQ